MLADWQPMPRHELIDVDRAHGLDSNSSSSTARLKAAPRLIQSFFGARVSPILPTDE